jgi:hypothetical protein
MAVALPRRSGPTLEVAPATRMDRHLGRLNYLHGWWYGARNCLGFAAVRVRLPGDVSGPVGTAREALLALDRDAAQLAEQLQPHLWTAYVEARAHGAARTMRAARPADLLHQHFRLEAVCAGPFGEERLVELAIVPRGAPGDALGAYVEGAQLVEFRCHVRLWRTP